jgi:hypothetical protein
VKAVSLPVERPSVVLRQDLDLHPDCCAAHSRLRPLPFSRQRCEWKWLVIQSSLLKPTITPDSPPERTTAESDSTRPLHYRI